MTSVTYFLVALACCLPLACHARLGQRLGKFQSESHLSFELAESNLQSELRSNSKRLSEWESSLKQIFAALPKTESGGLTHGAVRYALHRVFVHRFAWHVRGLEPSADAQLSGLASYIQVLIERTAGARGLGLRELAVLAATLEDLVHGEELERLSHAFKAHAVSTEDGVDASNEQYHLILATYMLFFAVPAKGGYTNLKASQLEHHLANSFSPMAPWHDIYVWSQDIQQTVEHVRRTTKSFQVVATDFDAASQVVQRFGEQFGRFQNLQCHAMKDALLAIEDRDTGRVPLSRFHGQAIIGAWEFSESREYLRHLGALDETNPNNPSVIIPNYLTVRSNCISTSEVYSVCCIDECEALMAHLESKVAGPEAGPQQIADIVVSLPSDTVSAPRNLSTALHDRLVEIANHHAGQIPLHGRLFAQWMHHVYPRECPYPQTSDSIGTPRTPAEWMQNEGNGSVAMVSEAELRLARHQESVGNVEDNSWESVEIPWSMEEELVVLTTRSSSTTSRWVVAGCMACACMAILCKVASLGHRQRATPIQKGRSPVRRPSCSDGLGRRSNCGVSTRCRADSESDCLVRRRPSLSSLASLI